MRCLVKCVLINIMALFHHHYAIPWSSTLITQPVINLPIKKVLLIDDDNWTIKYWNNVGILIPFLTPIASHQHTHTCTYVYIQTYTHTYVRTYHLAKVATSSMPEVSKSFHRWMSFCLLPSIGHCQLPFCQQTSCQCDTARSSIYQNSTKFVWFQCLSTMQAFLYRGQNSAPNCSKWSMRTEERQAGIMWGYLFHF